MSQYRHDIHKYDGQGKFVGSTVGHSISTTQEFFTVTEEAATTHGFADSEIGRNVIIAHFAPVSLAQELLN